MSKWLHPGARIVLAFGLLALLTLVQMIVLRSLDLATLGITGDTADQVRAALAQFWGSPWKPFRRMKSSLSKASSGWRK